MPRAEAITNEVYHVLGYTKAQRHGIGEIIRIRELSRAAAMTKISTSRNYAS
jgi:hypothetical protein